MDGRPTGDLLDHPLPAAWRSRVGRHLAHKRDLGHNFFASSQYNVSYFSTGYSRNTQSTKGLRKRPRDSEDVGLLSWNETKLLLDRKANEGDLLEEQLAADVEKLHKMCPKCFPPSMADPTAILLRNRRILEAEGCWPLNPSLQEMEYSIFHCAMLRGHKECMLAMHRRGIQDENFPVGDWWGLTDVEMCTRQDPSMLRFLYQLGHEVSFPSDELAELLFEVTPLPDPLLLEAVFLCGARFNSAVLLVLLENGKLPLFRQLFHRASLSGFNLLYNELVKLVPKLFDIDSPDLLHRLVGLFPELRNEVESWLDDPSPFPVSLHRYLVTEYRSEFVRHRDKGDTSHERVGNWLSSALPVAFV